ncbi:hypothetical protein QVD17_03281 [Tagetes erecta]|uniref:Uncharacterized protein n=1 Tax=Tagetes erecta TaxID=13708 RepID=A0AAD8P383_TARER|nr:hypothetical protein QVD17_03281 [Tagetes erecta]
MITHPISGKLSEINLKSLLNISGKLRPPSAGDRPWKFDKQCELQHSLLLTMARRRRLISSSPWNQIHAATLPPGYNGPSSSPLHSPSGNCFPGWNPSTWPEPSSDVDSSYEMVTTIAVVALALVFNYWALSMLLLHERQTADEGSSCGKLENGN